MRLSIPARFMILALTAVLVIVVLAFSIANALDRWLVPPPDWTPNADPLTGMQHSEILICGLVEANQVMPDLAHLDLEYHPYSSDHRLYPSSRGLCGIWGMGGRKSDSLTIEVRPDSAPEYTGFTVTTWSRKLRADPDGSSFDWQTTNLSEYNNAWWGTFAFHDPGRPIPLIQVQME